LLTVLRDKGMQITQHLGFRGGTVDIMPTATTSLDLPYRPCVGIMLINGDGLVWVGRRLPKWQGDRSAYIWQMPQGGITTGESAEAAALRELEEETAVRSVEVLAQARSWLSYDLPNELLGIALKGRYRGQKQKWFAMRFTGQDSEIDISARLGHKAEFDDWRWAQPTELPRLAVPFKRQIYLDVVRTFGRFLG
jgi:putative (di)nucleoside polyphosphate hydrolase